MDLGRVAAAVTEVEPTSNSGVIRFDATLRMQSK